MNKLFFSLILLIFIGLSSCATLNSKTAKSTALHPTVIQKPVVADLDVKETRVTGNAIGTKGESVESIKQLAIADALLKAKADVLVEPHFDITTSWRKVEVTVTGYPGTYKNFRPMVAEDTLFLYTSNTNSIESGKLISRHTNPRAKKIAAVAAGSAAAGAGLFFLIVLFL